MEKKTFNDVMANLPTTENDMTRVMVEMEDGRKGWISAEGLAQVMAGLMPVATAEKNGLMSTSAFNVINSMIGVSTTIENMIVKLTISGKSNLLCGCISNYHLPRLFSILRTSNDKLPQIKSFYDGKGLQFYGVLKYGVIYLYIKGLSSWGEFSIVPFCGNVGSIEVVAEIPDNVEALEFIE